MLEFDPSTRLQCSWTSNSNLVYASVEGEGGGKKDIAQASRIFSIELQLVFEVPDAEATADLRKGEKALPVDRWADFCACLQFLSVGVAFFPYLL